MHQVMGLINKMNLPEPHETALCQLLGQTAVLCHRLGFDMKDEVGLVALMVEFIAETREGK